MYFSQFRFDDVNQCLWQGQDMIYLQPRSFAVLRYLVVHAGCLVTKAELLDRVWGSADVDEAVLKTSISALRKILGDSARQPRFIQTLHRRGYRFVPAVDAVLVAEPSQHAI